MQYTGIYFPDRNVVSVFHPHDDSSKQKVTFFTTESKNLLQISESFRLYDSGSRFGNYRDRTL
jgi:hypothetical protein